MKIQSILTAGLMSVGLACYAARPILNEGHVDFGIAYEDGWDLHIHGEEHDVEYAPNRAILRVSGAAKTVVPDDAAYSFLGPAGRAVWILPKEQNTNLLFFGLGTEEIPDGFFQSNTVRIALKRVIGPGRVAVFDTDPFGTPIVFMNSRDGIDANDARDLPTGSHTHVNWAFSKPGLYRIAFEATGILADGTPVSSGRVFYTFQVTRPRPVPR